MGMAASQARYLGLTARKTNVEYEGQQINQARTALANQSANTFNDLLALEVPTAPSTNDYTTVQYSYEDGTVGETITEMTPLNDDPNYNYMVTHYHYSDVFTGVQSMKTNPQVVMEIEPVENNVDRANITQDPTTNEYLINGQPVQDYNALDNEQSDALNQIFEKYPEFEEDVDPANIGYYLDADNNMHFFDKTQLTGTDNLTDYYINQGTPTYVGNCELQSYEDLIKEKSMVPYLGSIVKDSTPGLHDYILKRHVLVLSPGNEPVQIVDVSLQMLSMVKLNGFPAHTWCQCIGSIMKFRQKMFHDTKV